MADPFTLFDYLQTAAGVGGAAAGSLMAWSRLRPQVDGLAERMDRAEIRERMRDEEISEVRALARHTSRVVDRMASVLQCEVTAPDAQKENTDAPQTAPAKNVNPKRR